MSFTIVSFHAHPDDEALLTGGTLARAAAVGHRVVLVVATAGEAGLSADRRGLGGRRRHELDASARALGIERVVVLGHADSGSDIDAGGAGGAGGAAAFADLPSVDVAIELATVLLEERADVITSYDVHGGYGHRDHLQVHRVGRLAAEMAGTPVVLEATVDRDLLARVVAPLRLLARVLPLPRLPDLDDAFTARRDLTHRVDVRRHVRAKRAALAAHASQTTGGVRTVALLLGVPRPLRSLVLGREWFREVGRTPGGVLLDDVFASLRNVPAEPPRGRQTGEANEANKANPAR